MANGINKVILIGNLGNDPDMRYTQSDTAVCNISVATSESGKDRDGNRQEKTEWHRVVAFGKLAEIMGEYLHKGSKVYVEGKLRTEKYEKDGETRYSTKVYADEMRMLDSAGGGERRERGGDGGESRRPPAQEQRSSRQAPARQAPARQSGSRQAPAQQRSAPVDDFSDDDIPF